MLENVLGSEIHMRNVHDVWYAECYHKINCELTSTKICGFEQRVCCVWRNKELTRRGEDVKLGRIG